MRIKEEIQWDTFPARASEKFYVRHCMAEYQSLAEAMLPNRC